MTQQFLHDYTPQKVRYVYNGSPAYASQMPHQVNNLWHNKILLASRSYTKTNCPAVIGSTWSASGDLTTNNTAATVKLRADIPAMLQGACYYAGSISAVHASARLVIWNDSAEACTISGWRTFQGDPTDSDTYWLLETNAKYTVAAGDVTEINLSGVISPGYLHDVKRNDTEMQVVFSSAKAVSGGGPKLLYVALYLDPVAGIDSTATVVPVVRMLDRIDAQDVNSYLQTLNYCNEQYNLTCPGSVDLVDQSTTGSGNYGYMQNLYYYTYYYHMLHSTSNSVTDTVGSIWVPTQGMGVYCSDGKWRYSLEMQCQQRTSSNITLTYYPLWFDAGSNTAKTPISTWSETFVANTDKTVQKVLTFESDVELSGFAFLPRCKKSGTTNTNMYVYTTLFSVKVIPYTTL